MTYSNLSDGRGTFILEIIRIHITWYGRGILGLENLPIVESGLKWLGYLVESSTNCENLGRKDFFEILAKITEKPFRVAVGITRLVGNNRVYRWYGCWLVITYQERGLLNHTPTWHEGPPSVRWLRSYI